MKRSKFIKFLTENKCELLREGSNHSIYVNTQTSKRTAVPRHNELDDLLCNDICKQLGINKINEN